MGSVSVVLCTYNGASFLEAQLESIARQTFPPLELIVSDDGSTDSTPLIVAAFARKAQFPVKFSQNVEKLGYGENFLLATRSATGQYIAFSDQDDVWLPEKLALCVEALEKTGADLCAHVATLIDQDGHTIGDFSQGIRTEKVYPPMTLPPWGIFFGMSQVFRRKLLDYIDLASRGIDSHAPSIAVAHDRWVYFLAISLCKTVVIPRSLTLYRQHSNNTFGGSRKSLTVRVLGKFAGSAATLAVYRSVADHRASLLEALSERENGTELGLRAAQASVHWRYIADVFSRRHRAYTSQKLLRRLVIWIGLVRSRVYDAAFERGHSARSVLLKDLCFGVFALRRGTPAQGQDIVPRASNLRGGQ